MKPPQNVLDLIEDLKSHWNGFEVLSKPQLAAARRQLDSFKKTCGGRTIKDSARPLNQKLEREIEDRMEGEYRDVSLARLVRRVSPKMVLGFLRGLPVHGLWLVLPAVSATLLAGLLVIGGIITGFKAGPLPLVLAALVLLIGLALSMFNLWVRLAIRLREYCQLKRRERLCETYIDKLHTLANPLPEMTRTGRNLWRPSSRRWSSGSRTRFRAPHSLRHESEGGR